MMNHMITVFTNVNGGKRMTAEIAIFIGMGILSIIVGIIFIKTGNKKE